MRGFFLKRILPHHGFFWQCFLLGIFCVYFFAVETFYVAFDFVVDELSDGHAFVNADGNSTGEFECPESAEANVTFACCGMDIDAEATR